MATQIEKIKFITEIATRVIEGDFQGSRTELVDCFEADFDWAAEQFDCDEEALAKLVLNLVAATK